MKLKPFKIEVPESDLEDLRQRLMAVRWQSRLNEWDQCITEIDGIDIHFPHIKSRHESARPLIMTHGWPGSIIEIHKLIDPLVYLQDHGGSAADAFQLVCPSLPGFAFSG